MAFDAIAEVRARLADPVRLAELLGLTEGAKREGRGIHVRCPVHAERTPSCSISRGADGTVRARCFGCDWSGDALGLVAAVRGLDIDRSFRAVLEEAARLCGVDLGVEGAQVRPPAVPAQRFAAPPPRRPPFAELRALWNAGESVARTEIDPHPSALAAASFFARRRWWPRHVARLGVARLLPLEHDFPAWWPERWAASWRLAVLAFDTSGAPASLHARAIDASTPKTRWPRDMDAGSLFFASQRGRALLAGDRQDLAGVVLVEGLTDFIAMALEVELASRPFAVLGGTSGSFPSLAELRSRWPAGVPAIVATDHDLAGERYHAQIRAALGGIDVRRFAPPSLQASA